LLFKNPYKLIQISFREFLTQVLTVAAAFWWIFA